MCHMPRPPHPSWLHYPKNIRWIYATNDEAPHNIFSKLLLLPHLSARIYSSATHRRTICIISNTRTERSKSG
jgi:hypothetical protein